MKGLKEKEKEMVKNRENKAWIKHESKNLLSDKCSTKHLQNNLTLPLKLD